MARNSSIELFRIVCAISVIILHFFGWFLGGLAPIDSLTDISSLDVSRLIFVSLTIVSVNCFVLISGYFGIELKYKKVINLLVMLLFIFVSLYFIDVLMGQDFVLKKLLSNLLCVTRGGYFVQCYFVLMILSPMLNSFVQQHGDKLFVFVLFLTGLELYADCIRHIKSMGIMHGYSIFHFCVMYLWGRCIFMQKDKLLNMKKYIWILLYLFCAGVVMFLYLCKVPFAFYYSNPIVIVGSIGLFIPFLYSSFHSKFVNAVASSTFTVFLLNSINPVKRLLVQVDERLYYSENTPYYLSLSFCVILIAFCLAVCYDKLLHLAIKPTVQVLCRQYEKIQQKWKQ